MSEGSKEHDWKSCIPLKGIVGSNPTLSAKTSHSRICGFCFGGESELVCPFASANWVHKFGVEPNLAKEKPKAFCVYTILSFYENSHFYFLYP